MRGRDEGGRDDQGTKGLEDQGTRDQKKKKNPPKKRKKSQNKYLPNIKPSLLNMTHLDPYFPLESVEKLPHQLQIPEAPKRHLPTFSIASAFALHERMTKSASFPSSKLPMRSFCVWGAEVNRPPTRGGN